MTQNKFNDIVSGPRPTNVPEENEEPPVSMPVDSEEQAGSLPETSEPEVAWSSSDDSSPAPVASWPAAVSKKSFRMRAYLPQYVVMLFLLGWLVFSINTLVGVGIDSLIPVEESASSTANVYSASTSSYDAFSLVAALSVAVVSAPLFVWLFKRTKRAETQSPLIKEHRWRKAFLAVFLVLSSLAVVGIVIGLAFDLFARLISPDGIMGLLSMGSEASPWWQVVIVSLLNAALLAYVVFVMCSDYRAKDGE